MMKDVMMSPAAGDATTKDVRILMENFVLSVAFVVEFSF
jgi:hypothetical protein